MGQPNFELKIDPIWQVFKIGMGFFVTGVVVQIVASLMIPQGMALATGDGIRSVTLASSGLTIANWSMGLGAAIVVVACVFFCVRATSRTK